jgi:hypothetical protein
MAGFLVVDLAHSDLSPTFGMNVLHLPEFILELSDAILLVVGDVFVNSETPVVTLSTSRYVGSILQRCVLAYL